MKNESPGVAVLYRSVARAMAACIVEGDDPKLQSLARACRRCFAPQTSLGRELALARSIVEGDKLMAPAAERLVENVKHALSSVDRRRSASERHAALMTFEGLGVTPAPDVRSELVDLLFSEWTSSTPNPVQQTVVELAAVKMLQESNEATVDDVGQRDLLAEKLLVERFNARYGKELTSAQQKLVTAVVLGEAVDGAVAEALSSITSVIDSHVADMEFKVDDDGVRERLVESRQLVDAVAKMELESAVEGCMRLFALVNELESQDA